MKKLAIMQPYLFPYIGYFQLIKAVDKFIFYDDVKFIKQGWINRNNILLNGSPFLFTIPIANLKSYSLINEVNISYDKKWKFKLLKTIHESYKRAPYFKAIFQIIESTFATDETSISRMAISSIEEIMGYLELCTTLSKSSSSYSKSGLKAQEKVLYICEKELADQYINPIGGQELYSKDIFKEHGIQLNFIKTKPIKYKQFNNDFTPNLSMLDVLMFNSREEVMLILEQYELI